MALALPATRPELDALKGNLGEGYGAAAKRIRDRAAGIGQSYDGNAAALQGDQAARASIANAQAASEDAGMLSAARNLGIDPVNLPNSRGDAVRGRLLTQRAGDQAGRGVFLGTMRDTAIQRNDAHAGAMEEAGRQANAALEREFQEYLASLASGYGGGGGGGRGRGGSGGYDDEPLVEYPGSVPTMQKGVVRGLATTSRRLTSQADAMKKAGVTGSQWADRIRAGLKKRNAQGSKKK